ncbi:Fungalysin/Thermolysin Extracellular metalloproteinase 5 [Phlyctochytrium bullatum]|nr:Fungalysin/Thermolysin Extracellular metalloproteinase 5 [Phlyctochytrium bullatum]
MVKLAVILSAYVSLAHAFVAPRAKPYALPDAYFPMSDFGEVEASPAPGARPEDLALRFLSTKLGVDSSNLIVSSSFPLSEENFVQVSFQESLKGIPIVNLYSSAAVDVSNGLVLSAQIPRARRGPPAVTEPKLPVTDAVVIVARALGFDTTNLANELKVGDGIIAGARFAMQDIRFSSKLYLRSDQVLELAWDLEIQHSDDAWNNIWVSATTGEILGATDWVNFLFAPGAGKPSMRAIPYNKDSILNGQVYYGFTPYDASSSPGSWAKPDTAGIFKTFGNNVDIRQNNALTSSDAAGKFDYVYDTTKEPSQSIPASVTNVFYGANTYHDLLYRFGFTEKSANFQRDNFGKGGLGNDFVKGNVQAAGVNNANFATPPDGQSGVMNFYNFDLTTPKRDSAVDNSVIIHELTHGLSNRLTGGSGNANCLQTAESKGMGEGWSDTMAWWATTASAMTSTTPRGVGIYVVNNPKGIRTYPYTSDKNVNPRKYSDIKPWIPAKAVHSIGEVWSTMLHEVFWNMIKTAGFEADITKTTSPAGNIRFAQLIVDGLKLQPCNPTFIQARDALLLADKTTNKSKFYCEIWRGAVGESFAIRAGFNLIEKGVTAAIGAGYSSMTQALSPVMDAYSIPLCDGSSTSPTLSSKSAYPNFFRTVPEDNYQAQVMVDFLIYQGWTEVAIVATQDSYGQNLANEVVALVTARNMTVTLRENFFFEAPDYIQIARKVRDSLSRIIIYCGHQFAFVELAIAAQPLGIFDKGYAWVTSDSVKLAASFSLSKLAFINGIINIFPQEGRFATYDEHGFNVSGRIMYVNGSMDKPFGSLREAAPRAVITVPNGAAYFIIVLTTISAVLCVLTVLILSMYRTRKPVKAASVELCTLAVGGLLVLSFYPVNYLGEPAGWKCVAEVWILPLSISTTIAALLCKTFRVFRIFNNKFMGVSITLWQVCGWVAAIVAMDAAISLAWTIHDRPDVRWSLLKVGQSVELQAGCFSNDLFTHDIFLGVEYGFHALLFLIGVLLSYMTSHLPSEYSQSGPLLSVMYAFSVSGIFVIAITSSIRFNKTSQVIIKACGCYAAVWLTLYNLFKEMFYGIFKELAQGRPVVAAPRGSDPGNLKPFKQAFLHAESCYVREKTSLGMVIWTPHVLAIPHAEASVYLFASRASSRIRYLFAGDWLVKLADRDPSVARREPFHAIQLSKSLRSPVEEGEIVVRFREEAQANEWLGVLTGRMKMAGGQNVSGLSSTKLGVQRNSTSASKSKTTGYLAVDP